MVRVIGANGSEKTSLVRALARRLPLADGSCLLGGDELSADRAARTLRFGFAPPTDELPDASRARHILELVGGDLAAVRRRLGAFDEALGSAPLLDR